MKLIFKIVILLSSVLMYSCTNYVCDKYYHLDEEKWLIDDTLFYKFRIDDVNSYYTMKINMKIDDAYKYRNLYFFTSMTMPDDTMKIDTMQFILNDINGKSYGKGISNNKELSFIINREMKFDKMGSYLFAIQHGMRDDPLNGIQCVGFIITKNR